MGNGSYNTIEQMQPPAFQEVYQLGKQSYNTIEQKNATLEDYYQLGKRSYNTIHRELLK